MKSIGERLRELLGRYPEGRFNETGALLEYCAAEKISVLAGEKCGLLGTLRSCPPVLFLRGDPQGLEGFLLGMVGTRRPSDEGRRTSFVLARDIVRRQGVVVSGLARGIDSYAHRGALKGEGKTVAVLGHGLDRIYPRENAELAHTIVESGGCLVSEFPPGVPPLPHHFPMRNRIIAGLSRGVIVIEATEKSGSLITAQFALDEGRDVFVVPGRYDDELYRGSHRLANEGAKLVMSLRDIEEEYAEVWPDAPEALIVGEDPTERQAKLLWSGLMESGSARLESLLESSPWNFSELMQRLEDAIRRGWIEESPPQNYILLESCNAGCLPNEK